MRNLIRTLFLSFVIPVCGCNHIIGERGNGVMATDRFDVGEFTALETEGNFDITLQRGETPYVTIATDENLLTYIVVEKVGSAVRISTNKNLISDKGVKVTLYYNDLKSIDVSGAARISSGELIKGDYLRVNMAGAGAVDLEVDLKLLAVDISGAGAVKLRGHVIEQEIDMNGAGGLEADELISDDCTISISGVGGASIQVREKLEASVSGIGGITYKGNPSDVQTDVSGLGQITRYEGAEESDPDV
ncbi:head GIN domain-containing protein [Fulvivirga sp. M361]|uniref:head GIN domain-containing protein n=1 Tax=Fulvivirga sp. M361 TaxID=2594266 RepID=UPI001629DA13|nr:head GIN domain-containing protein [Fulvivirga sp. M361]